MVYNQAHSGGNASRLNLLLSYAGWREQNWAEQLPRLLKPMGIRSYRVDSGREAAEIIRARPVHIAVVDLRLPMEPPQPTSPGNQEGPDARSGSVSGDDSAGTRLLELLRRLESPPPTVVVRRPADRSAAHQRTLNEALRQGAFAVLDAPVQLELVLELMRRILQRFYDDRWPDRRPSAP